MKPKIYFDPLYKVWFYFFLGWSEVSISRYLKKNMQYESDFSGAEGKTIQMFKDGGLMIMVWIRKARDIPAICHECIHAANYALEDRGVITTQENDEPLAYYVECLVKEALSIK